MSYRALITGSSSGIGFEYAKYLSKEGWALDLVSQNKERSLESEQKLSYGNAQFHTLDLGKRESINTIIDSFETPDLIVANAGLAINGAVGDIEQAERQHYYYLMCGGVIDLIEGFIPRMVKKGNGRIVIISSIGAKASMPKSSMYSSIKAGVYAYGRSISTELKDQNISTTVCLPGYVKTQAHERMGLNHLIKKIPRWMWVSPEQVVRETEKASMKGKAEVIPGNIYKFIRPFLRFESTIKIWRNITKRN
tara:strand:- start:335 stop:1087 length:753 start_codon:yes stop_codon:yes gene_type:complete